MSRKGGIFDKMFGGMMAPSMMMMMMTGVAFAFGLVLVHVRFQAQVLEKVYVKASSRSAGIVTRYNCNG